jgi:hypothetical protein
MTTQIIREVQVEVGGSIHSFGSIGPKKTADIFLNQSFSVSKGTKVVFVMTDVRKELDLEFVSDNDVKTNMLYIVVTENGIQCKLVESNQ